MEAFFFWNEIIESGINSFKYKWPAWEYPTFFNQRKERCYEQEHVHNHIFSLFPKWILKNSWEILNFWRKCINIFFLKMNSHQKKKENFLEEGFSILTIRSLIFNPFCVKKIFKRSISFCPFSQKKRNIASIKSKF
jgi:hypothetical protein